MTDIPETEEEWFKRARWNGKRMTDIIKAPWTDEQVAALIRWQSYGFVHEYTCPREHPVGEDLPLVVTTNGWWCPVCDYRQDWAHAHSFKKLVNPMHALHTIVVTGE